MVLVYFWGFTGFLSRLVSRSSRVIEDCARIWSPQCKSLLALSLCCSSSIEVRQHWSEKPRSITMMCPMTPIVRMGWSGSATSTESRINQTRDISHQGMGKGELVWFCNSSCFKMANKGNLDHHHYSSPIMVKQRLKRSRLNWSWPRYDQYIWPGVIWINPFSNNYRQLAWQ